MPGPRVDIRAVEAGDLAAIAAIYAHYVEHTYVTFDLDAPDRADWQRRWETAVAAGHPWWTALRAGTCEGFLTTAEFRPKPAYRSTVETTIYLSPEATGRGLGGALYDVALPELGRRGFHLATAGIALPNPASVALHERYGFALVGVFEEVGYKLGAWRDVGWWQRRLA